MNEEPALKTSWAHKKTETKPESDEAKFSELSDFIEHGIQRLESSPADMANYDQACRLFLEQVYARMRNLGIDFSNGDTIEPFFERFRLCNADLATKFEKNLRVLLNLNKIEMYMSARDVLYQKCMTDSSASKVVEKKTHVVPTIPQVGPGLFVSKTFWITVVVFFLIWLAYDMGGSKNHILTPQEKRDAITACNKWGGQVIYDYNGEYQDCAINGQIQ